MKKAIKQFLPTAESIERLLHPHAEVVIHDISQNKIAAIFNPYSKRRVGDSSLISEEEKSTIEKDCVGPYEKTNWDGKKLKSVSSIIRDESGKAVAMLCINLDISKLEKIQDFLSAFIGKEQFMAKPELLFKDDWQERLHLSIKNYLQDNHLSLDSLSREEKRQLICHLQEVGAFTGKNAAKYIANVLGVSRATIYNYLN